MAALDGKVAIVTGASRGIGEYIARALAEVQGGTLTYRQRAPTGSVFVVRLPAMDVTELEPSEWPENEGLRVESRE